MVVVLLVVTWRIGRHRYWFLQTILAGRNQKDCASIEGCVCFLARYGGTSSPPICQVTTSTTLTKSSEFFICFRGIAYTVFGAIACIQNITSWVLLNRRRLSWLQPKLANARKRDEWTWLDALCYDHEYSRAEILQSLKFVVRALFIFFILLKWNCIEDGS